MNNTRSLNPQRLKESLTKAKTEKSTFSSNALQTIQTSKTKPISSNPLYNLLPQTQNPNNIVNLITSLLKHQNLNFALQQSQNDLKPLLPYLGHPEIKRVLLRFQSDANAALTFLNWVKSDLGFSVSAQSYCLCVHILCYNRMYAKAMALLCEALKVVRDDNHDVFGNLVKCCDECNWNPVVFDMLVKGYVRVGMVIESFRVFMRMVEGNYGCFLSVVTCNLLLNALSKLGYGDECWVVYETMVEVGICRNSYTFNILVNVICEDGGVDRVERFLEKWEEDGFEPDLVTYNTLIKSYCKKGRLDDAFNLFRIMHLRDVMPDLVSYTALMNGLCKVGKVKEAHEFFHQMVHRGVAPDIVTFNTLISGYCKEGKMQESRLLLHEMIGSRICPDGFTCRVLIEGYAKGGWLISALNLIVELERFRVPISQDIYSYLIISLCEDNRPFAAISLLERISQNLYEPCKGIYNALIQCLCRCGHWEEALNLKNEMLSKDIKPELDTYRALISCLCKIKRYEEGESLMEEMVEASVIPDQPLCRVLVECHCKERNIDKAESILCLFSEKFQIFDVESYSELVKIVSEDGDMDQLMELQDRMLKLGYAPNSLTCKYMMNGLWRRRTMVQDKYSHSLGQVHASPSSANELLI